MICTVKQSFRGEISEKFGKLWQKRREQVTLNYSHYYYTYNPVSDKGADIKCRFDPRSFDKKPALTLEYSLPKLIFGNNIEEIRDIPWAVDRGNEEIAKVPGLEGIDIKEGRLTRLDLAYNHQVGKRLRDYIGALSRMKYPHRKTVIYQHESVYFNSGRSRTYFYDKFKESGDVAAKGMLRQEASLNDRWLIDEKFGKRATLLDVTLGKAQEVLMDDLATLGIDMPILGMDAESLERLTNSVGHYAAHYYRDVLNTMSEYDQGDREQLIKKNTSSMDNRIKKAIRKLEFAPVIAQGKSLPPLRIKLNGIDDIEDYEEEYEEEELEEDEWEW